MAAIDKNHLATAMDLSNITAKQLAEAAGISLTYTCDIIAGRRTLKRNPALRRNLAKAMNVPVHWIEHHDEAVAA